MTTAMKMHATTGLPWPTHGSVVMQVPGDNNPEQREANYARARECVHACKYFDDPSAAINLLWHIAGHAAVGVTLPPAIAGEFAALRASAEQKQAAETPALPAPAA